MVDGCVCACVRGHIQFCWHTCFYALQIMVKTISPITGLHTLNTINLHLRSQPALEAPLAFCINIFAIFNHWGCSQSFSIADASLLRWILLGALIWAP